MQHRCIIYQGTSAGTLRAVLELPARPGDILADGTTVGAPAHPSELDGAVDAIGLDVCRVPAQDSIIGAPGKSKSKFLAAQAKEQRKQYTSRLARGFGE